MGRSIRKQIPRKAHGDWICPSNRRDVLDVLAETNKDRIKELIPVRYKRMAESPFNFLRGMAAMMALDLRGTPSTALKVQASGDCHLKNFNLFATPERNLIFDINDFDETLPAPWEWDVKRLAVSAVLAGRENKFSKDDIMSSVLATVEAYRLGMLALARMSTLDAWYSKVSVGDVLENLRNRSSRWLMRSEIKKGKSETNQLLLSRLVRVVHGSPRIIDRPPLIYHPSKPKQLRKTVDEFFADYHKSLSRERRILLDRYRLVDVAMKVVGVGSVGTNCSVALLMGENEDPLFLQFKEARASVLETYGGAEKHKGNQGERVVTGQRIMQAASDVFLGWSTLKDRGDFYFRQLRDEKISIDPTALSPEQFVDYARYCGTVLSRAHARFGDTAVIAGYMGRSNKFEKFITKFALAYAGQVEKDYSVFKHALSSGRLGD